MSSSPKEPTKLLLELGDIITFIAPSNSMLNNKIFFIQYLDNTEIVILDTETGEKENIGMTDGILNDKTIEQVEILSRAENPGFAMQNNLVPGESISIQLGGVVPITINGEITSLEEDMIELSMWPDGKKIYIDFGYKGIPKNLPIESINIFVAPEKSPQKKIDLPTIDATSYPADILKDEEGVDVGDVDVGDVDVGDVDVGDVDVGDVDVGDMDIVMGLEEDLYESKSEAPEITVENINQERKTQLFAADEVVFGEELEELELYVDVPEEENTLWY